MDLQRSLTNLPSTQIHRNLRPQNTSVLRAQTVFLLQTWARSTSRNCEKIVKNPCFRNHEHRTRTMPPQACANLQKMHKKRKFSIVPSNAVGWLL